MVLYEVNLSVDRDIADAYGTWLQPHIREILALDGFEHAMWYTVESGADAPRVEWCVQYLLRDREALDTYMTEHAERLRGDGLARFEGRFEAHRRVLVSRASVQAG